MPRLESPVRSTLATALLCLAACFGGVASAEVLAVLTPAPLWVAPFEGGVATLLTDGTVLHVRGGVRTEVARGWISEEIWPCGDALYGVDRRGRIAAVDGRAGPRVAQYGTPACLASGDLAVLASDAQAVLRLGPDLQITHRFPVDALADTALVPLTVADEPGLLAVLAEPTFRYRHGILGDEVEASSLVVLSAEDLALVARWRLPPPGVIEQRTVVPYAFGSRQGFYVTRSTPDQGAGVIAVELIPTAAGGLLRPSATGQPIGLPNRWLNLFASVDERAYAVQTPHIGGPLVRYRLAGSTLHIETFEVGVTNHVIGSRNVELGTVLASGSYVDLLVLPTRSLHALRLVRCGEACVVVDELPLSGRLATNVTALPGPDDVMHVFAGDDAGAIHRFVIDLSEHGLDEQAVR